VPLRREPAQLAGDELEAGEGQRRGGRRPQQVGAAASVEARYALSAPQLQCKRLLSLCCEGKRIRNVPQYRVQPSDGDQADRVRSRRSLQRSSERGHVQTVHDSINSTYTGTCRLQDLMLLPALCVKQQQQHILEKQPVRR